MTEVAKGWRVETGKGTAAAFHHRPFPSPLQPTIWIHRVDWPALVLGSTQSDASLYIDAATSAGYEVCKRRSGGGLVVVNPANSLWIDVLIPAGHGLWQSDVGLAFQWLGRVWLGALEALGLGDVAVHDGPLLHREWGRVVCFAGLGPGEVSVDGRKVVGLSQRRTRSGARFQGLAMTTWDSDPIRTFLDPDSLPASLDRVLDDLPVGHDMDLDQLEESFLECLPPA